MSNIDLKRQLLKRFVFFSRFPYLKNCRRIFSIEQHLDNRIDHQQRYKEVPMDNYGCKEFHSANLNHLKLLF